MNCLAKYQLIYIKLNKVSSSKNIVRKLQMLLDCIWCLLLYRPIMLILNKVGSCFENCHTSTPTDHTVAMVT